MILRKNESIAVFLNKIHKQMYSRFLSQNQGGNAVDAKFLQTFLSDLKLYANNKLSSLSGEISIAAIQLVYEMTQETINNNPNLAGFNQKLFRKGYNQKIEPFEQELTHVVDAVATNVAKNPQELKDIFEKTFIGGKFANVQDINLDKFGQEVLQKMSDESQRIIKRGKNKGKIFKKDYVNIEAKQGKIDVKSVVIEVLASANQDLLKVQDILSRSTFSAKNYKNYFFYTNEQRQPWMNTLGLGQSNPFKAYYAVLSSLGYSSEIINYSFNRAYLCWKYHFLSHKNTGNAIFAIRQAYELIGMGLVYTTGNFGSVDYLVYNEHNTDNIYVKSVKEILTHFKNYSYTYQNPFTDKIIIEKDFFK